MELRDKTASTEKSGFHSISDLFESSEEFKPASWAELSFRV